MKVIIAKEIKLAINPREIIQFKKGAEYEVSGQVEERLRHYGCVKSNCSSKEVVKETKESVKKDQEDKPKKGKKRKADATENKRLNKEDENK